MKIALVRVPAEHTTAFYYERAIETLGHSVVVFRDASEIPDTAIFDLVLVVDPCFAGFWSLTSSKCTTAAILIDVHRNLKRRLILAQFCDHVFVAQPDFLQAFKEEGHRSVHWLPLGCDPEVHFVPEQERKIPVGFVGNFGAPGHTRHNVLTHVLAQFETNETARFYGPAEMGRTYSQSRIVFNKSIGNEVNMRVFEAMASGALLVTDRIGNGLADLATEGEHYIGYDTAEEAVEKIKHYLSCEPARARIAAAGQALVLDRHRYQDRLAQVLDCVEQAGQRPIAPARNASKTQIAQWRAESGRSLGISPGAAFDLVRQGLPLSAYPHLLSGLSRWRRQRRQRH